MIKRWAFGISFILLIAGIILAQNSNTGLKSGAQVFHSACISCHGVDGRGAPDGTRRFEKPDTFPDFTDCVATARESDDFWGAIIHNGGPGRAFSEIMPSFRDALTGEQIKMVMGHLRQFCREPAWPRGEMNLPRPLVTEKAFPEDEMVMDVAINAEGDADINNKVVYEKRLGSRGQLDVVLPFKFQKPDGNNWDSGVGDLVAGYKHVLASNLRSGSIFSLAGEAIFATGNSDKGRGKGVTVFEGFASYGQLLPKNSFLHFQSGIELPTDTDRANRAVFWRTVLGKTFAQDSGFGRQWSPMVELLADRELASGERVNWDIVPQFQVTLSRRQHIRANIGVRLPINDFGPRTTQVLFYLMWDTFDGGLRDGW
ncbi:MAG: cytochrome c [Acidobacteria bacterium]|nr:cytochrome c [Acidobacteriota bacterium]